MRLWAALLALAAAGQLAGAQAPEATDYRTRGHMLYAGMTNGGAACNNTWVVACAAAGSWTIRTAGTTYLKLEGPSDGFARFNKTLIDCPEAIVPITASGGSFAASGAFPEDKTALALVPETPFSLQPGSGEHSLVLLLTNSLCYHEFTLTQATGNILGVTPVQYVSWNGAAARALSMPLLLVAALLAAAAARWLA